MRPLVRDCHFRVPPGQRERQIDPRAEHAQHKRRIHPFAPTDPAALQDRRADPPLYAQIADRRIQQHERRAQKPHGGKEREHARRRIRARRVRRHCAGRAGGAVKGRDSGSKLRHLRRHPSGADRLRARQQAQPALRRKRTEEPHRRDRPEPYRYPLRCSRECEPQQRDHRDDKARRRAHVQHGQKHAAHFASSSLERSISCCRASISSGESR